MIKVAVTVGTYLLCFLLGSVIVRKVIFSLIADLKDKLDKKTLRLGTYMGICESFLIITFILLEAYTALALTITAKSIIRHKKMEENPEYYLLGTFLNLAISVLFGVLLKIYLRAI